MSLTEADNLPDNIYPGTEPWVDREWPIIRKLCTGYDCDEWYDEDEWDRDHAHHGMRDSSGDCIDPAHGEVLEVWDEYDG